MTATSYDKFIPQMYKQKHKVFILNLTLEVGLELRLLFIALMLTVYTKHFIRKACVGFDPFVSLEEKYLFSAFLKYSCQ